MKSVYYYLSVLIIFLSACHTNKSELETIKVAQFGDVFIYIPLYLANTKGFFKEEGLKVDLINTGGDDKTYAAVIGGSALFGIADPTFVAIAKEQGIDGCVIGSIVNSVPFWALTKNPNVPQITNAAMLAPYSVATFSAPSTAYTVQTEMFKEANLPTNIRQGAFGTLLPMLDTGNADIALELEPNVSIAVANGAKVVYSFADKYPDFTFTGITAYTVQTEMFKEANLPTNIRQGAFGTLLPMLDTGNADIALELEPNVSIAVANGAKVVYSFADKYPDFTFTGITTSKKTIDEKPEIVQHFINAITKAEKFAHEYPDSAAYYMAELYPDVNKNIIAQAIKRMVDSNTLPQNAVISPEAWKQAVALRHRMGDLKSLDNIESVLDMNFAEKAR